MHFQTDDPEKTNDADVTIVTHAIRVRTTMLSLLDRKFLRFSSCMMSITLLIF